jgi:hypothetical protein
MSRKHVIGAAFIVVTLSCCQASFSQYNGIRTQAGGYRGGGCVSGDSNFNSSYYPYGQMGNYRAPYSYNYGSRYSSDYADYNSGYPLRYGYTVYPLSYPSYYNAYGQQRSNYFGGGYSNGFTYQNTQSASYRYGTPRYYSPSMSRYGSRRFR